MAAGVNLAPGGILEGSRARMYDYILGHPGVTFLELVNEFGLGHGGVMHHIYVLQRAGLISTRKSGRMRKHYASATVAAPVADRDAVLARPAARAILQALEAAPRGVQLGQLAAGVGMSRQLVAHHLAGLAQVGLVKAERHGRALLVRLAPPGNDYAATPAEWASLAVS